jgi:hypothetical protein
MAPQSKDGDQVDPVSVGLLLSLAGGAGGELGRQTWAGLGSLVRRPFHRGAGGAGPDGVSSGEIELARLEQAPGDQDRAQALSTALAVRAALQPEFATALAGWHEQAQLVRTGDGAVNNTINDGQYYGPVIQGRDFSGTTFNSPPPPPAPPAPTGSTSGD